ncbi:MAG: hypothetical protein WBV59_20995, partial [Anaerolineae bacterium]
PRQNIDHGNHDGNQGGYAWVKRLSFHGFTSCERVGIGVMLQAGIGFTLPPKGSGAIRACFQHIIRWITVL